MDAGVAVNRLQYAPGLAGANGAVLVANAAGPNKHFWIIIVGPSVYDTDQTEESVRATIAHENRHVFQFVAIRDNVPSGNVWRQLDDWAFGLAGGNLTNYSDFIEADAHLVELRDENIGWFHLIGGGQGDLLAFRNRYNNAVAIVDAPAPGGTMAGHAVRPAARSLLQGLYQQLPFIEMKRPNAVGGAPGYDANQTVRPPE